MEITEVEGEPFIVKSGSAGCLKLGMILRDIRLANSFTQADIAANLGISVASISMMESGSRAPKILTVKTIVEGMPCLDGFKFEWLEHGDIDLIVYDPDEKTWFGFKWEVSEQPKKNDLTKEQNLAYLCLELAQRNGDLNTLSVIHRAQKYKEFIELGSLPPEE